MGAATLMQDMLAAGFGLEVSAGKLLVTPASQLTDELRTALRARKPELIELIANRSTLAVALAAAINRACDVRGDSDANRAGLLAECAALPREGQADMLAHFTLEAVRR